MLLEPLLSLHRIATLIGAASCLLSSLVAQPGWTVLSPTGPPAARWDHTLTWDPGRSGAVLHGGSTSTIFNDTWLWTGSSWQQIATGFPRTGHTVAYDAARAELLLFGGRDGTGCRDSLWVLNGTFWQQKSSQIAPPARCEHGMAYDSRRQRIVIFGGRDDARTSLGDVWEWDGQGWTDVTPSSGSPSPRFNLGMSFDGARGLAVVHGGQATWGNPAALGDTWLWDGVRWQDATDPSAPAALTRRLHRLEYDSVLQRVVMVGGCSPTTLHLDTWEWNGQQWRRACDSCMSTGLEAPGVAYDPQQSCIVTFGGNVMGSKTNETRKFAHASGAVSVGIGCPGSHGTPTLSLCPGTSPRLGQFACARLTGGPPVASLPPPVLLVGNELGFDFNLIAFGAPGCWLYTNPWLLQASMRPCGTEWCWTLPVPTRRDWIDQSLRLQAVVLDLPANMLGVISSNALDITFGVR